MVTDVENIDITIKKESHTLSFDLHIYILTIAHSKDQAIVYFDWKYSCKR